jgi:Ca-activated chloride channel family protein
MRKVILILSVSLLWLTMGSVLSLSEGSGIALADGMILPEALSPDYLVVRYHRVTVNIDDNHAVTRVEQEFYNPHPFPVEGRYLFPVPPEAILSRFQATVDGQPQQVDRQDSATTNATLYSIVTQRRDPSLLQYADWESLAFDLRLLPGGSRQMSLEYEEVLTPSGGLYHYRYVLSTERYSSQPLEEVSLTVDLHSSSGLGNLYSSTHPVAIERLGSDQARVRWEAQDIHPINDFELFFAPAEGGFGSGLLTGRRNGHDHFLFLFAPQVESRQGSTLPKDIVFVIDRSGSMSGEKIEQAKNALHFILGQLGENDRFSIVSFNDYLSTLAHTLQPVEKRALSDARRYVNRLNADGSTDLEAALQAGLDILAHSEYRNVPRIIVFLTDGLPTAGVTDDALIARLVAQTNARLEARLHVFGVGYDVNTHLLDRLAADNGGTVTYVQPGENLEAALTGFYEHIAHPVLTDVEVEFEGIETSDLYPHTPPDLFQDSSLLLAGRYQATSHTVTVRVRGRAGGERREYVYYFDLDQLDDRDFVPRLWATRRVGELLDQVRVKGESQTLVDEIQELSLGYGLVTPYTTFVIEGQADGPASMDNMNLYQREDLNQAWGETTVQARVQNQAYQQANQANLASGANVVNNGQHSLAQVVNQSVDLSLLQGQTDLDSPVTEEWIARNIDIDRTVVFGSEEYFALASDPAARPFLQSGPNVIFAYQGEVISIQEPEHQRQDSDVTNRTSEHQDQETQLALDRSGARPPVTDQDSEQPGRLSDVTGQDMGQQNRRPDPAGAQKSGPRVCFGLYAPAMLLGLLAVATGRHFSKPQLG